MTILQELNTLLSSILPVETGVFSDAAPDEYLVLTPMTDSYALFADNTPQIDVSEVRISLFSKGNFIKRKNQIVRALLGADFAITDRLYVGYEGDSMYHHFAIDVSKYYVLED